MDEKVKGENSIILPSLPCEEQGAATSAFFKNENMKLKLTHRRSNSSSNNSPTGISASAHGNSPRKASSLSGNNHYFDTSTTRNGSACICTKCHARITSLLSRSNPVHSCKSLCSECGLLQRQENIRKWKTLVASALKASKTTLVTDEDKLVNCSINACEHHNSPHKDHVIHIVPDVTSKVSPNHQDGPQFAISRASNFTQIDPNPENKYHEFFSCARAARMVLLCHHIIFKATLKVISNWVYIKWIFRVLNLLIEICQAILAQENGQRKLSDFRYQMSSVMISFFCLVTSLVEIIGEGKISRAVWQRKGYCCWFYYPGTERRLFGKFSLYFGIVSSMIQFIINLTTLVIKKKCVKFDSLPLILSFGHLVAAVADPGERFVVKCGIHGNCTVQCPQCEKNNSAL